MSTHVTPASDAGALVHRLTPIIKARVARTLVRRAPPGRDAAQEVDDLTQEVLLALFADQRRALRRWDPDRGMSLANFVGLMAERRVASVLRSARRSPWAEHPSDPDDIGARATGAAQQEATLASRQTLERVVARLRTTTSPLGLELFYRLFVCQQDTASICGDTGLGANAVYLWKSRLSRKLRAIVDDG